MKWLAALMIAVLGVTACGGGLGGPRAICRLAEADASGWKGLGRVARVEVPACLGPAVGAETHRTASALLAADAFRPALGRAEVRVYWYMNPGLVDLVEVRPRTALEAAPLLAQLGAPEATRPYAAAELAAAGLVAPPGGRIEEAIYARRGLAVVLAHGAGATSVLALRGFAPTTAARYLDEWAPRPPEVLE